MWINRSDLCRSKLRLISGGKAACKNIYITSANGCLNAAINLLFLIVNSILSFSSVFKDKQYLCREENFLSPSQCTLPYLASEHYGISKSCHSPGHRNHQIQQKDFSFERVVKVKKHIQKHLFNIKVVDLWECILGLFCGIVGNMTRKFHQNNIVFLLPCFHNHWTIATNVYRGQCGHT